MHGIPFAVEAETLRWYSYIDVDVQLDGSFETFPCCRRRRHSQGQRFST
jgi:hypothetical protein